MIMKKWILIFVIFVGIIFLIRSIIVNVETKRWEIDVYLPLTGKLSKYGEEALHGLELGFSGEKIPFVRLSINDINGSKKIRIKHNTNLNQNIPLIKIIVGNYKKIREKDWIDKKNIIVLFSNNYPQVVSHRTWKRFGSLTEKLIQVSRLIKENRVKVGIIYDEAFSDLPKINIKEIFGPGTTVLSFEQIRKKNSLKNTIDHTDLLIFALENKEIETVMKKLNKNNIKPKYILILQEPLNNFFLKNLSSKLKVIVINKNWDGTKDFKKFKVQYVKNYHHSPSNISYFGYITIKAILDSIKSFSFQKETLQDMKNILAAKISRNLSTYKKKSRFVCIENEKSKYIRSINQCSNR